MNIDPRTIIQGIEQNGSVPAGPGERFAGYAVIGLPLASGHALSLGRLAGASSVSPGGGELAYLGSYAGRIVSLARHEHDGSLAARKLVAKTIRAQAYGRGLSIRFGLG